MVWSLSMIQSAGVSLVSIATCENLWGLYIYIHAIMCSCSNISYVYTESDCQCIFIP